MQRMEQVSEFKEKLVAVNRVTKAVKGGRISASPRWSWSATKKAALAPAWARLLKFPKRSARALRMRRST